MVSPMVWFLGFVGGFEINLVKSSKAGVMKKVVAFHEL